jgi:UDP-glucuronate decarboxylase
MMKYRILVTGGAGFIGAHFRERLLQQGHDVLSVDNYYTGAMTSLSRFTSRWIASTTWPALPHPFIISVIPYKQQRLAAQ